MRKFFLASILLSAQMWSLAQQRLTLQQAFELAMEQNFSIQVAKGERDLTRLNNSMGASGMLPVVSGVINQDNQITDTRQRFLNGTENNRDAAKSSQLNGGVELNWTLFDGMRMFATKDRLMELEKMGETRFRQQMETVLSRVARSYFEAVFLREQLVSSEQFLAISQKRLEVAEANYRAGKSPRSVMLTGLVNLNADKAAHRKLETAYRNALLFLQQGLGMKPKQEILVADSLLPAETLLYASLHEKALAYNSSLKMADINRIVARLQLREARGERYPSLMVRGGYNFSQQESQAGFLQSSRNTGPHFGAGLSMNLFNGFNTDRKISGAQIAFRNSELILRDSLLKLEVGLTQAYNMYQMQWELFRFEQENKETAFENFELARLQHDLGLISMNDLRIAQQSYLQAVNRFLQAAFDIRISETELRRISGMLINPN